MAALDHVSHGAGLDPIPPTPIKFGTSYYLDRTPVIRNSVVFHRAEIPGGWETLGLRRFSGKALGLGVGLLVLFNLFSRVYQVVLTAAHVQSQNALVQVFATHSAPWWLWTGYVVAAPVAEELFFRGFVFGGLRPRYGWQKAAVLNAALFAVIHLRWTMFLLGLVLGYLLAYLYERSNSIWPGMLLHAWLNAWILGAAYYAAK